MKARIASVVLDLLAGLGALAAFVGADSFFHVGADLRTAIVTLALLYLAAGFLRGRGGNPWLKGFVVSAGGVLVLVPLGLTSIDHTVLVILVLTAMLFAICGGLARQNWATNLRARASLMIFVPLAAVAITALALVPQLAARIATRKTAAAVPAFAVSRLDGSIISSTEWHGRVVVIDYWATWCPACRREMPELDRLCRRYQANPNVVFWAIDVQKNGETPQKANAFVHNAGYTLPLAIDSQNSAERMAERFAFEGFPTLMVIDRAGQVRLLHSGYDGSERLQENLSREIDALLRESL